MNLFITGDGSHSVAVPESNLTYHSIYGAIRESMHVFILPGLLPLLKGAAKLRILEIGFGTGLNALLTFIESQSHSVPIHYTALEPYPLNPSLIGQLNYCKQLGRENMQSIFYQLHQSPWEKDHLIKPDFTLHLTRTGLLQFTPIEPFQLIYFDAFAPAEQPELWDQEVFRKMAPWVCPGGRLLTYSAKGEVRRSLRQAGFEIKKLPGASPKKEMTMAIRPAD